MFVGVDLCYDTSMLWDSVSPLSEMVQLLATTRLRVERLRLMQKVQQLEGTLATNGVISPTFAALKNSLHVPTPGASDRVDRLLVLPRKAGGVWRRKYLTVRMKPGSVF